MFVSLLLFTSELEPREKYQNINNIVAKRSVDTLLMNESFRIIHIRIASLALDKATNSNCEL